MGVLNVTPDSFYDGGRYWDPLTAVRHGQRLAEEGADVIDVGGESTRPGAEPVELEEELRRVIPVIEKLKDRIEQPVSIDTRKAEVARRAIGAGARMVNDVSGLTADPDMTGTVAAEGVPVVIMHTAGTPRDMQRNPGYRDTVGEIVEWLDARMAHAVAHGIRRSRIIVDPGIGFGKRLSDNLLLIRSLASFRQLNRPILIGPSRKSFIGRVLDAEKDDRMEGTAAAVALSVANGASIVRVHDVREMSRVVRMTDAIRKARQA
ncbi:MAG: dihydropteroate synthase [Gemmatimonadetes bacterium]|nr:dihydropteroate synthase [Gemmatimonadota bacterium]MYG17269.1 dihydropteroate synthase [Gemmatimonadota bacterium]